MLKKRIVLMASIIMMIVVSTLQCKAITENKRGVDYVKTMTTSGTGYSTRMYAVGQNGKARTSHINDGTSTKNMNVWVCEYKHSVGYTQSNADRGNVAVGSNIETEIQRDKNSDANQYY